ncbi:MAG: M20/M25/M40 family metallo-hydrolase, partial [Cyanobacteriota bacterium]
MIPAQVVLRGSVRYFRQEVRQLIHERLETIAQGVARAHGAEADVRVIPGYPATVNTAPEAAVAAAAMAGVVGEAQVSTTLPPTMGAEDFAYLLEVRPGAYGWIGNGPGTGGCLLHNPLYDFN